MTGISGSFVSATTTTTTTTPVGYAASTKLGQLVSNLGSTGYFSAGDQPGPTSHTINFNSSSTLQDFVNFLNGTGGLTSGSYDAATGQLSMTIAPSAAHDGYVLQDPGGSTLLSDLGFGSHIDGSGMEIVNSGNSPITLTSTLAQSYNTTSTTTTTPGSAMDLTSVAGAKAALSTITSAISQLAADRATVGSNEERLSYTSSQLSTLNNNLAAAKSGITDVDVAQESTTYARQNILMQSGTAMLAQANSLPQSVMRLLS
jgi:flagellin